MKGGVTQRRSQGHVCGNVETLNPERGRVPQPTNKSLTRLRRYLITIELPP